MKNPMQNMFTLSRIFRNQFFNGVKALVLCTALVLLAGGQVSAQTAANYTFTTGTTGFTLDAMTGATSLIGAGQDDAASAVTNIGFPFTYENAVYTQFSVNSNGLIRLGGTAVTNEWVNNLTVNANNPKIMPVWDDLCTGTGGSVSYLLTGTAPNRILKIQHFGRMDATETSASNSTFQTWLYEGTNLIRFVYGTVSATTSATIGIGGITSTNYMAINTATGHTAASTAGSNAITTARTSGRWYLFTPQTAAWRYYMYNASLGSSTWCAGESRSISISIKNTGTSAWSNAAPDINVGVLWASTASAGSTTPWSDYHLRTDAGTVAAGGTATYTFTLEARNATSGPTYGSNLAAGTYYLAFDIVNEANCWFRGNTGNCNGTGAERQNFPYVSPAQTITALPSAVTVATAGTYCGSTTLTATGGSPGTIYWQGTNSGGTSTATASSSQAVSSTGTYYFRAANSGCWGTEGSAAVVINPSPTLDGTTVNTSCWVADNTNDYTITVKATGTSPTDIGGSTYGMLALVNYQGAHAGNHGGYYAWNTSTALLNAVGFTQNQMACTGGGFVGMYASGFGNTTASLQSASTSVSGNQRTVNFVVRPNATFPAFNDNSISQYAMLSSGCPAGWVETTNLITTRQGDPTVFGSSTWNVYAYEGQNRDNLAALTYKGYYTQNLGAQQGFNTQTAWANTLSPSNAATYLGCTVPADGHTFVHKRQGFTAGTYQITIDNWDDESIMYINGTEVWRADVWSGNPAHGFPVPYTLPSCYVLGAGSTIEFRTGEGGGGSNAQITLTQRSAVSASLVPTNQASCNNGTGSIDLTPSGGTGSYTYNWSTGATTQDISSLVSGTYNVTVTDQVCTGLTATGTANITAPWTANAGADQLSNCSAYTSLSGSTTPTLPTGTQTIFQENFDGNNGSVTTNSQVTTAASGNHKWQIVNTTASTTTWWISNSANGFTCAIGGNSLLLKDGSNVKCDYQWDNDMTNTAYCNVPVNATGATNLNLKFDYNVGGERITNSIYDYMSIVYSTNGTSWTALNTGICNTCAYSANTSGLTNTVTNAYQNSSGTNVVVALPAALNNTSFYIGFRWNNDGSSGTVPGMVVDNISITGDYPSLSYTWSGPGSFNPNNTSQTPSITSPGTFTLSVAYSGCTSTDQVVVAKETTAPTLSSCPASQTGGSAVNANASCFGTATWTAPSWTDNCLTQPTIPGATKITGVTSGNYYYVVPGAFTWAAAKADAIAKGGKLAVIENATENSQLATWFAANGYTSGSLWMGYTDEVTEGTYKTITGVTTCVGNYPTTQYGYTNWNAGEPNNAGGDEDYAEYIVTTGVAGLWNDLNSTTTNTGYILEFGLFQTAGLPPGCTYFPLGNTVNTYNATDFAGNTSSTCSFTVEVKDVTNPVITCPANTTVACGASTLPAATGTATATDNCSVASITYTDAGTVNACGGTITRTWKATDGSSNIHTCDQSITVSPASLPTMTAPGNITVACGGVPSASTITYSNGLSGGCLISGTSDASTFSAQSPAGACGGTITETWTATDACGRTITPVSRTITVSPAALPTMTAPGNITIACGTTPTASTISYSNGLSGGCLISGTSNTSTFSTQSPAGACGGTITETWTATDACGRTLAPVSRTIIVSPAALPTMTAPGNITVPFGSFPSASTIGYSNALSGGCLISGTSNSSTFSPTPTACVGSVTETWTATDACGRTLAPVTRTITVIDDVAPNITTCPATQTVTVATNCQATIPNYATLAATPSTDNCTSSGSLVFSQSPVAGSYASYGSNSVTITVKDAANNQTSCITNFVYTAPSDIVSASSANTCVFAGNSTGEKFLVDGTTNEALVSINEGTVNLGTVTATVTKHGSVPAIAGSVQCDAPAPSSGPVGGDELYLPREFDVTTSNAPSGYVNVSLYFTQAELTALANATASSSAAYQSCWGTVASNGSNLMLTIHHSDNTYETRTQGGGGLTIASTGGPNGTYKASFQVNKFSGFQFHGNGGVNGANGLPVQMLYFTANEVNNTYVRLDWATALEINNDGFWVERSSDGVNWTSLAWIEGHDNSTVVNAYSYDDHAVASNILYYYRLKQLDNDGVFEYSGIETARLTGSVSFAVSEFIPNPTTAATHILITSSSEAAVNVVVYDLLGQKVTEAKQQLTAGVNQLDFNFGQLAAGTYTATITSGNATYTKRVVLTK